MWIKCLDEGQKCQALTGMKPAITLSKIQVAVLGNFQGQYFSFPYFNDIVEH